MDAATIQAKVYGGYAKAAAYVGQAFNQYRPANGKFVDPSTLLGTINAAFTVTGAGFGFEKPGAETNYVWNCLANGAALIVGDILQSASQTFFVAAMQPLLPIAAILTNATITIKRPTATSGVGFVGYSGDTAAAESLILASIPAAIRLASSGRNSAANGLPSDSPGPLKYGIFCSAALLSFPPVQERDVIYDNMGRRFQVAGLEMTPIGPRIDTVRLLA